MVGRTRVWDDFHPVRSGAFGPERLDAHAGRLASDQEVRKRPGGQGGRRDDLRRIHASCARPVPRALGTWRRAAGWSRPPNGTWTATT